YAEGPDVYRSFAVVPELDAPVWVEAVEFNPGNYRVAHHAFFAIDRTGRAIDLDAEDAETGFAGMSDLEANAQKPIDQFLSWQVGRQPDDPQPGVAWRLNPGDVIVFEMHLIATGKPEQVQATMGLHFADQPPTKHPVMVAFVGQEIDIPAGESEYVVTNEYRLPIEATVTGILPHAHYLGKQTHAWATLPDGSRQWLIRIDDWDLNWQSAYYYAQPIHLPAGSVITQHFVFDNSAANPRNPFSPPRHVQYGREATDEMAELHVQFMFDSPEKAASLRRDSDAWRIRLRGERFERALARNPNDAAAQLEVGKVDLALGRADAAQQRFEKALELDFDLAEAHYFMGYLLMLRKDYVTARVRFTYAVSIDPSDFRSQCGIAKTYFEEGNYSAAGHEYAKALNLNDDDPIAHVGFANTLAKVGQYEQAARHFREAYRLDADNKSALYAAQTIEAELKRRSQP
ncbi:MAG: tetratricopeptide repeat protein, partial [Planctomycetales bacterium]|nr:tetratricopeptide repeat protein [Planctomycetales bacterium]